MFQSTSATTPLKLKLNKPPEFNGSYKDYRSWIQKVELFLHGLKVNDDEEKILVTLFFMTSGPTLDWCQAFADNALQGTAGFGTWMDFTLWEFQSLDEIKTLVYMEIYILNRCLSLEESFILNIVED